ncbi:MAG: FAD-binding protein [Acidimicrobiia bacterium]
MSQLADLEGEIEGAPEGVHLVPASIEDLVRIVKAASANSVPLRIWGGGTRQKMGYPPPEGWVVSTRKLSQIEVWEPDDLTVVAGAGIGAGDLETRLAAKNQTAVLPENPGSATLGGVLATGRAPLRRARHLGMRERVLEVTSVTGDGRVVRSGGRVVKNVSGFDLHKAAVGAFGSLGIIALVCLKLWPVARASATIRIDDREEAVRVRRPLALLESPDGIGLFVSGTEADVDDIVSRMGGRATAGLHWPDDPAGAFSWSLRIPPSLMGEALNRVAPWDYLAVHGTGELRLASDDIEGAIDLRAWAEKSGGSLVLVDHPGEIPPLDPWGTTPETVALQRELIAQFDPARIINPGRLPGGI